MTGRCRARDLGIAPGVLPPGPLNAITDVAGVRVGHLTLIEGDSICTGVTAILPHGGNLFQDRVPAGLAVGNGFGKLMGGTQLVELGEIETPIVLTNTLAVPQAAEAVIGWTLAQPGNEAVGSIMIIIATDAPLSDRNLTRLARRALAGLARTGAAMSDGSGDYAIAFSTAEPVRRTPPRRDRLATVAELPNALLSPLFEAVIEATEEAIYNALCMATAVTGHRGVTVEALPLDRVVALLNHQANT